MDNVDITFLKPGWQLTAAARAECEELSRRLADPQDLEDGFLAVAVDEMTTDMIDRIDAIALKALGFDPSCTKPAASVEEPALNSHFSANPADLTAFLLSSTDQPRWLRNP